MKLSLVDKIVFGALWLMLLLMLCGMLGCSPFGWSHHAPSADPASVWTPATSPRLAALTSQLDHVILVAFVVGAVATVFLAYTGAVKSAVLVGLSTLGTIVIAYLLPDLLRFARWGLFAALFVGAICGFVHLKNLGWIKLPGRSSERILKPKRNDSPG